MRRARAIPQSAFNIWHDSMMDFLEDNNNARAHLWQHQIDAVLSVQQHLHDPTKPNIALVVLPTGAGKSGVAVLSAYAVNASKVLMLTPSSDISDQMSRAFGLNDANDSFLFQRTITNDPHALPRGVQIKQTAQLRNNSTQLQDVVIVHAHQIDGASSVRVDELPVDNWDLVIVDEAHHYPAPTWRRIVDRFPNSRRLFITATPEHGGRPILENQNVHVCFRLTQAQAVERGILRPRVFEERRGADPAKEIAARIRDRLSRHDEDHPAVRHQAMVLCQTAHFRFSTDEFVNAFTEVATAAPLDGVEPADECKAFVAGSSPDVLQRFKEGRIRTLVVAGKLHEGFDHKNISVVGIYRNVNRNSTRLFAQFVGRALRRAENDPITAVVVSHEVFHQQENYNHFDQVNDAEQDREENDDAE